MIYIYIAYFKICSTHLAIYRINDFVWRTCGLLLTALACFSAGTFGDCWPTLTLATWHDLGKLTCTIFHRFSCPKASSNCLPCCPSLWYEHYELFAPHKIVFCPHFFRHIPLPFQPFGDPSNFTIPPPSSPILTSIFTYFHQHFLALHQISSGIGSPEISAPFCRVAWLHGQSPLARGTAENAPCPPCPGADGAEMCGDGKAAAFWAKGVKKYGGNVD